MAGLGNGGTGGGGGGVAPPPLPFAPRAFLPGTVGRGRGRGTYQIHFPLVGIHDAALAGPLVFFWGGGLTGERGGAGERAGERESKQTERKRERRSDI